MIDIRQHPSSCWAYAYYRLALKALHRSPMNYERIYKQFIESRREREADLLNSDQYVEIHHILPRSLGGTEDPKNTIVVTPEDHLFGHLLLAQIYNGKMWLAVKAMLDLEPQPNANFRKITNSRLRKKFGFARRKAAQWFSDNHSGQNHPGSDKKTYLLRHTDGRTAEGNRSELIETVGIGRGELSGLLLGEKGSWFGWYCPELNPEGQVGIAIGEDSPIADKHIYNFYHESGEHYEGTTWSFSKEKNIPMGQVRQLVQGGSRCLKFGWALTPEEAVSWIEEVRKRAKNATKARGDISGVNNPRADQTEYKFVNVKTNESITCKRSEFAEKLGVTSARMAGMMDGHYKVKGWTLKKFQNKKKVALWDNRGKSVTIQKDGQTLTGTRTELAKILGVDPVTVAAFARGHYKTCRGWVLIKLEDD